MGKRSEFEKKPRDAYFTIDPDAVKPLVDHLEPGSWFIEPCAGAGNLTELIVCHASVGCIAEYDKEPVNDYVREKDCLDLTGEDLHGANFLATNPPFTWKVLDPIITHLSSLLPTWLLLPADMMHNKRMYPHMQRCSKVVSVGRLYWEENKVKGKDNYCFYLFHDSPHTTVFYGRK